MQLREYALTSDALNIFEINISEYIEDNDISNIVEEKSIHWKGGYSLQSTWGNVLDLVSPEARIVEQEFVFASFPLQDHLFASFPLDLNSQLREIENSLASSFEYWIYQ